MYVQFLDKILALALKNVQASLIFAFSEVGCAHCV